MIEFEDCLPCCAKESTLVHDKLGTGRGCIFILIHPTRSVGEIFGGESLCSALLPAPLWHTTGKGVLVPVLRLGLELGPPLLEHRGTDISAASAGTELALFFQRILTLIAQTFVESITNFIVHNTHS